MAKSRQISENPVLRMAVGAAGEDKNLVWGAGRSAAACYEPSYRPNSIGSPRQQDDICQN